MFPQPNAFPTVLHTPARHPDILETARLLPANM
jgi:hypothetical protein